MSVVIAVVVLLIFFLLVGKFSKCCYYCSTNDTDTERPYHVAPNPMDVTNATSRHNFHCPTYDNAVTTTTITVGQTDFEFTSPMPAPQFYENRVSPISTPPSYYQDPPPSYDQACGITNSMNKQQSRQI